MSALQIAALIGAAIVLGTGHLCVGLAIGWYMGRRAGMVVQPVNMEPFVASVEQIRGDLGQLSRMSRQDIPGTCKPMIPISPITLPLLNFLRAPLHA